MKNFKNRLKCSGLCLTLAPLYIFTIVFVAMPLLYMVILSFETRSGNWGVSADFTLKNYMQILNPVYFKIFLQSLRLSLISTGIIIAMGYPFGYYMAKLGDKWKKRMMILLLIPFWTSSIIRLYGWIVVFRAGGPVNRVLEIMGLTSQPLKFLYTYPAVVLGMVYALLPFMILSVYSSAEKMDWNLVEAARDLGASKFRAFVTITLKMTMPGLLTGVILTFVPSMGLFYIADILGGNKVVLIGSIIQEQLLKTHNWPFAAALSIVLMVLTLLLISLYKKVTKSNELEGLI